MRTMMSSLEAREDSRGGQLIDNPARYIQDIDSSPMAKENPPK